MVTRSQVVEYFTSVEKTAEFFGITVQAVYQWPEGEPIPRERELELMVRIPDRFKDAPRRKPRATA